MEMYCCLLKSDEQFFLQCEQSGEIVFFQTKQEGVNYWESGYKNAYARGICGATGALLTYIACQPSVINFKNEDKMFKSLFKEPPYKMSSFMGYSISGILCQKNVEELWDKGYKPELIKQK